MIRIFIAGCLGDGHTVSVHDDVVPGKMDEVRKNSAVRGYAPVQECVRRVI
jgi:hypothetical protein